MKHLLILLEILLVVMSLNYLWTGSGHTPAIILLLAVIVVLKD